MENVTKYKNLDKSEIRNFLSDLLVKNLQHEIHLKREDVTKKYTNNNTFSYQIEVAEQEIKYWQIKLQIYKERVAIYQLVDINGWSVHEMSDDSDGIFIGTHEEHKTSMQNIKNDIP